jgi:hypothetical protein
MATILGWRVFYFFGSCLILATYRNSLSKIWRILPFFSLNIWRLLFGMFSLKTLYIKFALGFSFGRQSAKTRQKEKHCCQTPSLYKFTKTEAELNTNGREAIDTSWKKNPKPYSFASPVFFFNKFCTVTTLARIPCQI